MPFPFLSPLLIILFAAADRIVGEGGEKRLGSLGGRSLGMLLGSLGGFGLGYLAGGLPVALMGLVWVAQRSLPWKLFGGASNPEGWRQIVGTLARHVIVVWPAIVALLGGWFDTDLRPLPALMFVYAFGATGLASLYARQIATLRAFEDPETNEGARIELYRGALYGACLAAFVFISNGTAQ